MMRHKRIFIECENGHIYQTTAGRQAAGYACPMCRSNKIIEREKIEVEGKGFSSLKEVAEKYSLPETYLKNAMRRGISVSEAIKRRQQRTFTIYGKPYESIKVAADEYNEPFSFLMKRRRAGMPLEEAIDGWHQKEPRLKDKSEAKRFGDWKGYVDFEKKVKEWDDQFNSVSDYVKNISKNPKQSVWSDDDKTLFDQLVKEGRPIDLIAAKLQFDEEDIIKKLIELNIFEEHALANADYLQMIADEAAEKVGKTPRGKSEDDKFSASDVRRLISSSENTSVEFKQTFSRDLKKQESKSKELMHSVVKTIAGFANAAGGTLLIGVADDKEITGLELDDYSGDHDAYYLKIGDKVNECLTKLAGTLLDMKILKMENSKEVCVITVKPSSEAIYCRNNKIKPNHEWFFVRQMAKTEALLTSDAIKYIKEHFKD